MQSRVHSLSLTSRKLSTLQCFQHQWEKTSKSFLALLTSYLFLSVLYIVHEEGSLVIVFLLLQGRAWFHLSLVQKKLSSFMQSLLSRQEVLRYEYTASLPSSSHPPSTSFPLFSFLLSSNFTNSSSPPILQTALLLHFSPNPFTLLYLPQSLSTLQLLQLYSLSQITLPPWCIPVLRRAYWACWNTQMFRLHWLQVGALYRHLNDTSAQCCHDNIHLEAQFVLFPSVR